MFFWLYREQHKKLFTNDQRRSKRPGAYHSSHGPSNDHSVGADYNHKDAVFTKIERNQPRYFIIHPDWVSEKSNKLTANPCNHGHLHGHLPGQPPGHFPSVTVAPAVYIVHPCAIYPVMQTQQGGMIPSPPLTHAPKIVHAKDMVHTDNTVHMQNVSFPQGFTHAPKLLPPKDFAHFRKIPGEHRNFDPTLLRIYPNNTFPVINENMEPAYNHKDAVFTKIERNQPGFFIIHPDWVSEKKFQPIQSPNCGLPPVPVPMKITGPKYFDPRKVPYLRL